MVAQLQVTGRANVVAALIAYASVPKFIQWGTGTGAATSATAVTAGTTTESRTSGTTSSQTTTTTDDTFRVTGTVTAAGTRAITEVGVFDAAGSGNPPTGANMCIYADFSVVNLSSAESIAFTIDVKFT